MTPSLKPPKKLKFDSSSAVVHEIDGWQVMDLTGSKAELNVHSLSEYDVLMAKSKSMQQQCEWIYEYFTTHCPFAAQGVKNIPYVIVESQYANQ